MMPSWSAIALPVRLGTVTDRGGLRSVPEIAPHRYATEMTYRYRCAVCALAWRMFLRSPERQVTCPHCGARRAAAASVTERLS